MPGMSQNPVLFGTLATSFAISQPLSFVLDVDIQEQNKQLTESETLTYGTHNEAVNVLQKKLKNLNMFKGKEDGNFGVITEHYVKKFQAKYNLNITGRANKETIYKLIQKEREHYLEPLKNLEEETIDVGMYSEDVKKIQSALHYFGYYDGSIDGIYGPLTKEAAKAFQEDHKIPVKTELDKQFVNQLEQTKTPDQDAIVHTVQKTTQKQTVKESGPVVSGGLIQIAKSYLGSPYTWGGESPSGFDCSGYLQFVFSKTGVQLPRTVSDIWNATTPVEKPSVGDLVFYETYKPGPSHAGIYLGNGNFIHAGNNGVEISNMSGSYWQQRYLGAKRVSQ
ncbi:Cell wall-associated hydrolase, NlpC family [Salinibacillus kushneri]|uniref:Cell wall-associated hydrolase, NlpC family n=1 Tax=Salinibacillus kushneri TaxID=237682 RepID=A0A1I0DIR9_9BACI|nr:NlpC/P60 family protein [Salinibacillus kushneri]SET32016.1 Cell wall-associated hydrolase, NlpC family [Salinibacillus kushneri]